MVDRAPSDMDDLFNFGVPSSRSVTVASGFAAGASSSAADAAGFAADAAAEQFSSRRAARDAQGARRAKPAAVARRRPLSKRETKAMARAARSRQELSRPSEDRKAIARAMRGVDTPEPRSRKLKRRELAVMRASAPKPSRKHPLSVLVTMAAVGGMFAVAGLPAYALTPNQTTAATDKSVGAAQSIVVGSETLALAPVRDGYKATTSQQLAEMSRDSLRAQNNADYLASGARELGDDYPWAYELSMYQGGGLSPLNYFYRQCVDFVAWRLNRDAGYYAAPYKWVWSTLTPSGGDAYQWKYAWQAHGWTVSDVPIVGSVAWFSSNHVAYVKSVLDGGYVLVEEYNFVPNTYSQRTLPLSAVDAFLYPPPA